MEGKMVQFAHGLLDWGMIPLCFIAHMFWTTKHDLVESGEKTNPFSLGKKKKLKKIKSALKATGEKNNLYLLPRVPQKYFVSGPNPRGTSGKQ